MGGLVPNGEADSIRVPEALAALDGLEDEPALDLDGEAHHCVHNRQADLFFSSSAFYSSSRSSL